MGELIRKYVKGAIKEVLDKAQAGAPAFIKAQLANLGPALTASVDPVSTQFRKLYGEAAARLGAWAPTKEAWLTAKVAQLVVWAKATTGKL